MSAKGPENTFIGSVHKHLPVELYRMKNHNMYNGGIADCWYSGDVTDLWVEYKFIKVPARADTIISLTSGKSPEISHLQQEWLHDRAAEGRNVGVIVGCKEGGVWFGGLDWLRPCTSAEFRARIQTRPALAQRIARSVGTPAHG